MRLYAIFILIIYLMLSISCVAVAGMTERISVSSSGVQGSAGSDVPCISADGRYIAFSSSSSNLVPGDTNGCDDIFVRDRASGTTERINVSSSSEQGNSDSYYPSISADGRYVVFWSYASNLVLGDTNGCDDIFVRDRVSGTTERVSVSSSGEQGNEGSCEPSISADGRYVAFCSLATNIVPGDTNGQSDVFVRDRVSGTTERISVSSSREQANSHSEYPSISADGRYVAFQSYASNLVLGDTNMTYDVFIWDRVSKTTEMVSVSSNGTQGNRESCQFSYPSISADGRYVAFYSLATNLVPGDTNGCEEIFVRDRVSRTTEIVSVSSSGTPGNNWSEWPSISADGRYVAFTSWASNLVSDDTSWKYDIFVRDRVNGTTERVSISSSGEQGNQDSAESSISADGRYITFYSYASNLVPGDTNRYPDIFVRDRWADSSSTDSNYGNLSLFSNPVTIGDNLSATVTTSANTTKVELTFSGLRIPLPPILLTQTQSGSWQKTFSSSVLNTSIGGNLKATAKLYLSDGQVAYLTETLMLKYPSTPPTRPGNTLWLSSNDTGTYGLAESTFQALSSPGSSPLEVKLLMSQDLNLWFGLNTYSSGGALEYPPSGWSFPEIFGKVLLINPGGTVAWMGKFYNPNDSVTMELTLNTPAAATANVVMILMHLIPGASAVPASDVVNALNDFKEIAAISSASTAFSPAPQGVWGWTKACGSAAWSLRNLATDSSQRAALGSILRRFGVSISDDGLKQVFNGLQAYSLLKIIASEITYIVQTKGDTIKSTFTAYGSAGGGSGLSLQTAALLQPQAMLSAEEPLAEPTYGKIDVDEAVTPSRDDWTVNYSITNQGTGSLWSWSLYYDPQAGAPIEVLSPSNWNYVVDSDNGIITWFTEGSGGWVAGDYGANCISASGSLSGFSIRHASPPEYCMCSGVDTANTSLFGDTIGPSTQCSVGSAKMRNDTHSKALSDRIVTAVLPNSYYISDPVQAAGIQVMGAVSPVLGDKVRLAGDTVVVNGEAVLQASSGVVVAGTDVPNTLGLNIKNLGGSPFGLQEGMSGGIGLNNIGLLVRTWGTVTAVEQVTPPAVPSWFVISDSVISVKVSCPKNLAMPEIGKFITVTGISSCELDTNGTLQRLLKARKPDDVWQTN